MPKFMRRKALTNNSSHKFRVNKGKNYKYHNPEDVKAKIGDEDVAGTGHHYCAVCFRYFATGPILLLHRKSKAHKKQAKLDKWERDMEEKMNPDKKKVPSNQDEDMTPVEEKETSTE